MPARKRCGSGQTARNGAVGGKQRYHCKERGCSLREGDGRTSAAVAAKKAMCALPCAMAKDSLQALGRMSGRSHTLICRWAREFGEGPPEPGVTGDVGEMGFDGTWRFAESKKTGFGSSRRLIVSHGEPLTVRKRKRQVRPGARQS